VPHRLAELPKAVGGTDGKFTCCNECTVYCSGILESNLFARNEENPIDADLLIVDEFSMVDALSLQQSFEGLPECKKDLHHWG
jgi:ATP-dependent exoDNAse (exonuclease V) alpha subunit